MPLGLVDFAQVTQAACDDVALLLRIPVGHSKCKVTACIVRSALD